MFQGVSNLPETCSCSSSQRGKKFFFVGGISDWLTQEGKESLLTQVI